MGENRQKDEEGRYEEIDGVTDLVVGDVCRLWWPPDTKVLYGIY